MIWPGVCGLDPRRLADLRRLAAVEIPETFEGRLDPAAAGRWRERLPRARFSVIASRSITHPAGSPDGSSAAGAFRDTPAALEGWAATRAAAEAIRAEVIVFLVPDAFGPSDANRTALYRFFDALQSPAVCAIELGRSWASHVAERICEDLRLVHVVDPLEREPATYGLAYFRLPGGPPVGPRDRRRYSDGNLDRLRDTCVEYDDAYAIFRNRTRYADALRFSARAPRAIRGTPPAQE